MAASIMRDRRQGAETANWRERPVLVVEPGSLLRRLMAGALREAGASKIYETGDEREAQAILSETAPGLILADWSPDKDQRAGLQLVRELRRDGSPLARQTPFVVMSSRATNADIRRARDAGATEYLLKPVSTGAILDRAVTAAQNPRTFIQTARFSGPERRRRRRPFDMAFKRGADVSEGRVDALSAARHACVALARELALDGCTLAKRVTVSLNRYLAARDVFTASDQELIEMHRAALAQLELSHAAGEEVQAAVVAGLEQVVAARMARR